MLPLSFGTAYEVSKFAIRLTFNIWKHVYGTTKFLYGFCAVLEEQKSGVQKEASDLRTSLHEVEKARMETRRELQELRRTAKVIDGERSKLAVRVNELLNQVARDEEKEEEARRENFSLKQKVYLCLLFCDNMIVVIRRSVDTIGEGVSVRATGCFES